MKTKKSEGTGDGIRLEDKTKYQGRVIYAQESEDKQSRMKARVGVVIKTGQGEAKRWGGWLSEVEWVQEMFGRLLGESDDADVALLVGRTLTVTLKTHPEYGQEIQRLSPGEGEDTTASEAGGDDEGAEGEDDEQWA